MVPMKVNGRELQIAADPDTPLLWALREDLFLTGTKFGCGHALCGACTVHLEGEAARSCSILVRSAAGRAVTTIEGLSGEVAVAVRAAWFDAQVAQCGYCQPGFVMAVTSVLMKKRDQTAAEVLSQITNICRCGTYDAIRSAVAMALRTLAADADSAKGR
jgi:isoquinoline 1-oxidoreductase alpha subunit